MGIKLSVLGVRGALPAANRQFMEYGGNTSCICLECGDELVCFDAGSGLSSLCEHMQGIRRLHILVSHVHIDHILGLYGFHPPGDTEVHIYGWSGEAGVFRRQLETSIGSPYWPVEPCKSGLFQIHELAGAGQFSLHEDSQGRVRLFSMQGNHPGGSLIYRAELDGIRITYTLDCEMCDTLFPRLAEFAADSDILIWDANFTQDDKHPGWGHSTWEEGLALGRAAGAKQILMTHYARDYTDAFLREQELLAKKEYDACIFAREGVTFEL